MRKEERISTGLLNATQELRELIIAILTFRFSSLQDKTRVVRLLLHVLFSVSASVGEYLDCMQTVNDEYCYTDRDEFQEDLENLYSDFDGSDKEFEQFIENIMVEYEPYWKKCIILYVDN